MKRLVPVLGAALLIVLLALVNRGINRTAHPDDEDAPQSSSQKDVKPSPPTAGQSAPLPSEIIVGDPATAKHRITVGWTYDEKNEADPQSLTSTLQAVQQMAGASHGAVSAEIVDLDVPPTERSPQVAGVADLGISVDGKPVGPPANPGSPGLTPEVIARSLTR